MKTVQTITVDDLQNLKGQFIVQLDHKDTETKPIKGDSIEFYATKRIALVTQLDRVSKTEKTRYGMVNMFGNGRNTFGTAEEFVEEFNAEGKDRYYRLLTPEELNTFNSYMIKQRQYL